MTQPVEKEKEVEYLNPDTNETETRIEKYWEDETRDEQRTRCWEEEIILPPEPEMTGSFEFSAQFIRNFDHTVYESYKDKIEQSEQGLDSLKQEVVI